VGDLRRQKSFAEEIMRVSERWFITTPNFWFPVETHWKLPLIHFLPEKTQRRIMSGSESVVEKSFRSIGPLRRYFSTHGWHGQGLHLLSAAQLRNLFPDSKIKKQRTTFYPEVLIAYLNHFPGDSGIKRFEN
jgi:hypothetical protein